jgi:eukaryotic-like serine/threonine-protein kinase
MAAPSDPLRLERLPAFAWYVIAVVTLAVLYTILQILVVRPYLWPAGAGVLIEGDPVSQVPLKARPPDVSVHFATPPELVRIAPDSPAAKNSIAPGTRLLQQTRVDDPSRTTRFDERLSTPAGRIEVWRELYRTGVKGAVRWEVATPTGESRTLTVARPAVWSTSSDGWARRHLGMVVQTAVFAGAALLLLLMRSYDLTAGLCVLALAFSAVGGGGPLLGIERGFFIGPVMTVFAWIASPLAFPAIALAILYFPARTQLLDRHRWLHAIPLVAALPLVAPASATALYLSGVEAARDLAVWDAVHPGLYFTSFACALGINVLALGEGAYRYRFNHNANERRRIRMALYTAVPGVLAYAVRDGLPIVATLAGADPPEYPTAILIMLDGLVLLPAFGLVYAVGVAHVLGPRLVLRRSLQYALANRTLTVLMFLPVIALTLSLVRERDRTLADIATSSSALYLVLIVVSAATFTYRERARQWLDQRFFREEYDARKILLSLASRVRFETDPAALATMVVNQLDEALHPLMTAILVSGVEDNRLSPVTVLHGSAEPLPLDGGLVSMLRWSDEPLEIVLNDPRSPARRLPPEEREWLECTGAVLLVPVLGQERALIAVIALGERRSEEAYTSEDRQLLASIAAQMGLGFDVARFRRRGVATDASDSDRTRITTAAIEPMMECPRCGRCEESRVSVCPADGTPLRPVPSVPRTVDNKYRIEQLLGRGGMGAVYRARDMRLDRLVALKVVRAELLGDPEARRRFRREAQIVARLQHPSIVAVFDYGTFADGGAYLVMELVRGEDLRHMLQREGRLEIDESLSILMAVCGAIGAAHREGVLHRDLKPENILLPTGGGPAKVLDFGVAKLVGEDRRDDRLEESPAEVHTALTAAGMIVGTPAYMAPEQFHAVPADARTDVFSLGVVAYEMLSGELPFGRGTLAEVVLAQARGVPAMPSGIVTPAAERAIRTALDADPDRRPASPQQFATLLSAALEDN